MAQSVKCLLNKHVSLNLDPPNPCKKLSVKVSACNSSPGEAEKGGSWPWTLTKWWASSWVRASDSKNKVEHNQERYLTSTLYFHVQTHKRVYTWWEKYIIKIIYFYKDISHDLNVSFRLTKFEWYSSKQQLLVINTEGYHRKRGQCAV